jgi:hypothetical protein
LNGNRYGDYGFQSFFQEILIYLKNKMKKKLYFEMDLATMLGTKQDNFKKTQKKEKRHKCKKRI